MRFTLSERKHCANLREHGLDFLEALRVVVEGLTFTLENGRFAYAEPRFVTLGLLAGVPVFIAHTGTADEVRITPFRKATRREAQLHFREVEPRLVPPTRPTVEGQADRRAS